MDLCLKRRAMVSKPLLAQLDHWGSSLWLKDLGVSVHSLQGLAHPVGWGCSCPLCFSSWLVAAALGQLCWELSPSACSDGDLSGGLGLACGAHISLASAFCELTASLPRASPGGGCFLGLLVLDWVSHLSLCLQAGLWVPLFLPSCPVSPVLSISSLDKEL